MDKRAEAVKRMNMLKMCPEAIRQFEQDGLVIISEPPIGALFWLDRFKELTQQTCKELNIEILAMECHHDHVHLFLKCWPQQSPAGIMKKIKGASSRVLRDEFPVLSHAPSLWTRSYFVSTAGDVCSATIQRYVETQKTRS